MMLLASGISPMTSTARVGIVASLGCLGQLVHNAGLARWVCAVRYSASPERLS